MQWFGDEKGFGFITPDDQSKDLFVHHSGTADDGVKTLAEGAKVEYDAQQGPKGPIARVSFRLAAWMWPCRSKRG